MLTAACHLDKLRDKKISHVVECLLTISTAGVMLSRRHRMLLPETTWGTKKWGRSESSGHDLMALTAMASLQL